MVQNTYVRARARVGVRRLGLDLEIEEGSFERDDVILGWDQGYTTNMAWTIGNTKVMLSSVGIRVTLQT